MIYKVWIHVEEIDEKADHYQDVAEPVEVACFEKKEKAERLVELLEEIFSTTVIE